MNLFDIEATAISYFHKFCKFYFFILLFAGFYGLSPFSGIWIFAAFESKKEKKMKPAKKSLQDTLRRRATGAGTLVEIPGGPFEKKESSCQQFRLFRLDNDKRLFLMTRNKYYHLSGPDLMDYIMNGWEIRPEGSDKADSGTPPGKGKINYLLTFLCRIIIKRIGLG